LICHIPGGTWAEDVRQQGAEEDTWVRKLRSSKKCTKSHSTDSHDFFPYQHFSRDKNIEDGTYGACGTYEGGDEYTQGFGGESRKT